MKNNWKLLAVLTVAMILIASVAPAKAYFTTYTSGKGEIEIELGYRDKISEEFADWTKSIDIKADDDAVPQYIRVKVFYDDVYPCTIETGSNWEKEEEEDEFGFVFYNFTPIVYAGQSTLNDFTNSEFNVKINEIPDDVEIGSEFNVVVVYECTQVLYDANGIPLPPNWSRKLTFTETLGGEE